MFLKLFCNVKLKHMFVIYVLLLFFLISTQIKIRNVTFDISIRHLFSLYDQSIAQENFKNKLARYI